MQQTFIRWCVGWFGILFWVVISVSAWAGALPGTIQMIKPSVVAVGSINKTRRPPSLFLGTGFAVSDGFHVVTNAHVISEKLNQNRHEFLAVFYRNGSGEVIIPAKVVAMDSDHDLCLLKIDGKGIAPLQLGRDQDVREGELFAFSGFPLGAALGLTMVTHRGMISAITPVIIPVNHGKLLNSRRIDRLVDPYPVFQMDATAYPGNSGSPLYDMESGRVVGIINMVFVKGAKENAIKYPSGITYAIPVSHIKTLMEKAGAGQ